MNEINWSDFEKVELRVGTITAVDEFPEARKPAYKLTIEFGEEIGVRTAGCGGCEFSEKADWPFYV